MQAENPVKSRIDFQTEPSRYRHWRLEKDGNVASLIMDVDPAGGLNEGYELKLNSYDLGVDIELNDAVQRLRFEHPDVQAVIIKSGKDNVFCAGANIKMLGLSAHGEKVNFCKFTNETRNGLEDSSENSGQRFVTVINGTAAGGGYELALATDHIILADDDIRYTSEDIRRACELLKRHDMVRPQNYLAPLPWWGRIEAARMLINAGDAVWMEDPGYSGARGVGVGPRRAGCGARPRARSRGPASGSPAGSG